MAKKNFKQYIDTIVHPTKVKYPKILIEMMDNATGIYMPNDEFDLTLDFSEDYVLNFNFERNIIYVNEFCEHPVNHIFYSEIELEAFYKSKLAIIEDATKTYKTRKSLLQHFSLDDLEKIRKTGLKTWCKTEHRHSSNYAYELLVSSTDYELLVQKNPYTQDDTFFIYKSKPDKEEYQRIHEILKKSIYNDSIFDSSLYILNKEDLFKMIETSFSVKL